MNRIHVDVPAASKVAAWNWCQALDIDPWMSSYDGDYGNSHIDIVVTNVRDQSGHPYARFHFQHNDTAILFKLRWGGQ